MPRGPLVLFLFAFFLLGATAGVLVEKAFLAPEPVAAPEPKALSPEEIAAMCADVKPSQVEALQTVQQQVTTLQTQLAAKEAELAAAEAEASKSKEAGDKAAAKVKALQAEVSKLKTKVSEVVQQRDQLLVELKTAVDNLEAQVVETEHQRAEAGRWKTAATGEAWRAFASHAKVQLCDRGTAKRHDKCDAAVDAALTDDLRRRFETCVDSGQATPSLGQLDKAASLPEFAVRLPDDKQFGTKGWYVLLCDPTLPEAAGEGVRAEDDVRAATGFREADVE